MTEETAQVEENVFSMRGIVAGLTSDEGIRQLVRL